MEIYSPLASNVVCDQEPTHPVIDILLNRRCKGIISIDVSFPTLKVRSTVGPNERMPT